MLLGRTVFRSTCGPFTILLVGSCWIVKIFRVSTFQKPAQSKDIYFKMFFEEVISRCCRTSTGNICQLIWEWCGKCSVRWGLMRKIVSHCGISTSFYSFVSGNGIGFLQSVIGVVVPWGFWKYLPPAQGIGGGGIIFAHPCELEAMPCIPLSAGLCNLHGGCFYSVPQFVLGAEKWQAVGAVWSTVTLGDSTGDYSGVTMGLKTPCHF